MTAPRSGPIGKMVTPILRSLHRLGREEDGAMAPAIAGLGVVMVASVGMALDTGLYFLESRDLRAATDAAALAAAMYPDSAQTRAQDYLQRNNIDPSVLQSVETGRYCPDSALDAGQRFIAGATNCANQSGASNGQANAVRVTTRRPSRRYLSAILGGAVIPDQTATATAARIDEAGIGVTSGGLLDVTNPLVLMVNDLLGALLGIQLRLGTAEVEALMGGNVDAGLFFDSLAERSDAGNDPTYSEVAQGSYGMADIALAAADATSDNTLKSALTTFASQVSNSYQVPLQGLFDFGVWEDMPVGESDARPALRAGMNAYQLISYAVQAGPVASDLSDLVSTLVPVSSVKIGLVSSLPGNAPRFSFGAPGETSAFTAALRLQILLDLPVEVPLVASVKVHVPVLLDVAASRAEISQIDCADTADQRQNTRVTVNTTSGLVNAYIGDTPFDPMDKSMPAMSAADIENTSLARISMLANLIEVVDVRGRAVAQPVSGTTVPVVFGPGGTGAIGTPDAPQPPVVVGNPVSVGDTVNGLVTSLLDSNELQVKILSTCAPLLCSANESWVRGTVLPGIIRPVTGLVSNTVDPLLTNLLAALGIQLGHASVWTTGARCGVPVLV